MYSNYFGFNEKPFTLTPNPRFIYLSKSHKDAFAHLLYGINNHYGFIELIGEVGTGKTTVLRTLLGQLHEDSYRCALIFNPCLSGVELLRSINHEFGLPAQTEFANELLAELNRFLLAENSRGVTVVLVIDEAQNLQPVVLEQLRLISNLETENDKLIQIVLAGQPELESLLAKPELRQLNQRIAVRYKLKPMSSEETNSYIGHRMTVAGETGGVSFSRNAIRLVHLLSGGTPREINNLCDRALLIAYGDEQRTVTPEFIARARREIQYLPRKKMRARILIAAIVLILVAGIATQISTFDFMAWRLYHPPAADTVHEAKARQENSHSGTDQQRYRMLEQELQAYDQNDVHLRAFNTLIAYWGAPPVTHTSRELTVPKQFTKLAKKRNLHVTAYKGSLEQAIRFGMPILVETRVTGTQKNYCLAVTPAKNNSCFISPTLFNRNSLSLSDLQLLVSGTFYLVWHNSGQLPDMITADSSVYMIKKLQLLLTQAGSFHGAVDGMYGLSTAQAIRDFQQTTGIAPDESVGELTLAVLSHYGRTQKTPSPASSGQTP
ncbi:MAG TPA: AAA family ATPase [Desulfuromonadales bacterium]|nr:AAA family ATPase [Desulfuromonadales bacterium]